MKDEDQTCFAAETRRSRGVGGRMENELAWPLEVADPSKRDKVE